MSLSGESTDTCGESDEEIDRSIRLQVERVVARYVEYVQSVCAVFHYWMTYARFKEALENESQSEDEDLLPIARQPQLSGTALHTSPSDPGHGMAGPSTLFSVNQELAKYQAEMKELEEQVRQLREEVTICERGGSTPSDVEAQGEP